MIVIEIKLISAISRDRDQELGTMIIDNIGGNPNGRQADYRARMYRKGALKSFNNDPRALVTKAKHTREGQVLGHNRLAEPVQNLVSKALTSMGYK